MMDEKVDTLIHEQCYIDGLDRRVAEKLNFGIIGINEGIISTEMKYLFMGGLDG